MNLPYPSPDVAKIRALTEDLDCRLLDHLVRIGSEERLRLDVEATRAARQAETEIDLSRFPLPIAVTIRTEPSIVRFQVGILVVGREAGTRSRRPDERFVVELARATLALLPSVPAVYASDPSLKEMLYHAMVAEALRLVRSVVLHELDECTLVRGERIYDPHTERRRPDAHP